MEGYVFVLHSAKCPQRRNKFSKKCRCRKWIYEYGTRKRYSAKTRSWEQAEKLIKGEPLPESGMTVKAAVLDYISDKKEQNVCEEYQDKLTLELKETLLPWCEARGIQMLAGVGIEELKEFRKSWVGNPLTRSKKQERLRSFFLYCQRHKWIADNPAALLSRIKVDRVPTDYFTDDEFAKILAAVDQYHPRGEGIETARQRARAMLLLLRWSGLRIGDACRLERMRLAEDGRLLLYMAKTHEPVYVRLPDAVAAELRAFKGPNPTYFFWTGTSDRKTVVNDWWRTLSRIFKHAAIGKRAHPHMMRDTFAVNFLLAGGTMEELKMLLGHTSIKTTEKHYSPWVKARQERLDEAVRRTWV